MNKKIIKIDFYGCIEPNYSLSSGTRQYLISQYKKGFRNITISTERFSQSKCLVNGKHGNWHRKVFGIKIFTIQLCPSGVAHLFEMVDAPRKIYYKFE